MNVLQKKNKHYSVNSPMSILFPHHCFQKHIIIKQYLWSLEEQLYVRYTQNNVLKTDIKVKHLLTKNPITNKKPPPKTKTQTKNPTKIKKHNQNFLPALVLY